LLGDIVPKEKIGDRFQQQTKYYKNNFGSGPDWSIQPDQYKHYTHTKQIILPKPYSPLNQTFDFTIRHRKSIRDFLNTGITKKQLSYLLWVSTGIQRKGYGYEFRTAPSAGALYPIETYLVIHNVGDISPGVYHYNIKNHRLEELKTGDFRAEVTQAALNQHMCYHAAIVFIWTAIFNRSKCKYGQRAYRYIYLDAGHIAQNLALGATSLNLGSCQIAAIFDDEINEIINVDGTDESVLYLSVVGVPTKDI
jgi:SagB-type dehydrogenase family enzyme